MAIDQEYKERRVNNLPTSGLSAGDKYALNVGGGKYQTYIVSDSLQLVKEAGAEFIEKDTMAEMRALSAREIWALQNGYYKGVKLNGYYAEGDTPASIEYYISSTSATDDGGSLIEVGDVKLEFYFGAITNGLYFGVSPDIEDNSQQLINLFNYTQSINSEAIIPVGVINYNETINFCYRGAKLAGCGSKSILQYTGDEDVAFEIDAWKSGSETAQYVDSINVRDIIFSGNNNASKTIHIRGISRANFNNVWVGNGKTGVTNSSGWYLGSVQLSKFHLCGCSDYIFKFTSKPYYGMIITVGARGSVTGGNSSNNTFDQCYFERLPIGLALSNADNNTFNGGSPESCDVYGMVVSNTSRYNTFIGVGFENPSAIDIADSGRYSTYRNCYSSSILRFGSQCFGALWEYGYNGGIEVQAGAQRVKLSNSTYNYWGSSGITDAGTDTIKENLYNWADSTFIKNNKKLTGFLDANSIKVQTRNTLNEPINQSNTEGGFSPIIVGATTGGYPNAGVALAVDRTGNFDNSNSRGSFKLYSRQDDIQELFFNKKIGNTGTSSDWGGWRKLILNTDLATPTVKGLVNQATALANISQADLVATTSPVATVDTASTATDVAGLLTDLNDLISKYNVAVALINELKTKYDLNVTLTNAIKSSQNTELTNQRAAGQQAT